MRFLADGEVGVAGGAEDVSDIVVKVLRLVFPRWNRMDVEVEDAVANQLELLEAGFLLRFLQGHRDHIRIAIGMATELEPAIELPMMRQQDFGAIRRHDPGRAGDVADGEGAFKALWLAAHKPDELGHRFRLGGMGCLIDGELIEKRLTMHAAQAAGFRRKCKGGDKAGNLRQGMDHSGMASSGFRRSLSSRRSWRVLLLLTSLAFPVRAAERPNILFILADDLGYGDLGCYNPEAKAPTPAIDKLAAQGMRFTDAHSPSTVCTPTRYSIQTGRMAFRTGNRSVFTGAGGPGMIEEGRLTLPEMLRGQGYSTALIGKWHVGLTFSDKEGKPINNGSLESLQRIDYSRAIPDSPIHRGFDRFFGTACCPTTDWLYAFIDGDRIPVPPTKLIDKSHLPKNPYTDDCRPGMIAPGFDMEEMDMIFLKKSLQFLDEHHAKSPDKPFLLFHSTQAVHLPSFPGKQFQGKTKAGPHGDFIAEFDHVVATLLKKLEELGIADNTLVMLSSDNGPEVPTVVNMRKDYQHDGARPWRGVKRDQWEGGHRVPFIVRWPGKVPSASTSAQTTCLTDVMATCASIVGAKLPDNCAEDSIDMSSVLMGKDGGKPVRDYTLHQTWTLQLAIRQGDWKYLDHQGSGGNKYGPASELGPYILPEAAPDAPAQLYNLAEDPGETKNLILQHPDIAAKLKALLDQSKASGRSAPVR